MDRGIKSQAPIPHIPLTEGAANLRELSGYPPAERRRVKEGLFYRGGALYALKSDTDRAAPDTLGIKLVLDFRSSRKRKSRSHERL